ncbi:MAG: L-2-amino-thiazoline-4-carboxylic acid hydrolase [Anaerolineae bacterium]|jgi:hypothetical protein|nr:L-2-amino-thiazoline-4-carboxylic acid hydrolase [Anaerolineae bacterium]
MTNIPCCDRTFLLRVTPTNIYTSYLRWLNHLGERLGYSAVIRLWQDTAHGYQSPYLVSILSSGWESEASDAGVSLQELINENLTSLPTEISLAAIKQLILNSPPIAILQEKYAGRTIIKETSAYNALYLRFDFLAVLTEALIRRYGKQGELVVYDILVEERLSASKRQTGTVEEFIESMVAQPEQPNLFTAGIESELIHLTQNEVELHIHQCEWARYFKDHHPEVGYLMACSTDEVAYKAFNNKLRMQRTETLMEGGSKCDFRISSIPHAGNEEDTILHPEGEDPRKIS